MRLGGTLTPCSAEGGCALSWHQVLWSPVTLAADAGCGSLLLEPLRGVSVWCSHHPLCLMTMRFLPQGCGGDACRGTLSPSWVKEENRVFLLREGAVMTEVLGCCVLCTHGQAAVRLLGGKGKFTHLIYLTLP